MSSGNWCSVSGVKLGMPRQHRNGHGRHRSAVGAIKDNPQNVDSPKVRYQWPFSHKAFGRKLRVLLSTIKNDDAYAYMLDILNQPIDRITNFGVSILQNSEENKAILICRGVWDACM